MNEQTSFRVPNIGDTIRTTTPLNCDGLTTRAGDYLYVVLETSDAVAAARELVALERWCVIEKGGAT